MSLPFQYRDPISAMAEFEQILASNSGEDPFDSAIKLLASKLVAEYDTDASIFQIQTSPDATHRVVQSLYRKALERWPQLNGNGAALDISPQHLVRSMRPLVGWRLRDSDLSWLDATLERLVSKDAKGALGQYFTPRDIVRFCIQILNPGPKDKVIDPACGSGGFLFEATLHSIKEQGVGPSCLGIDFGARAIKVAALLAAATPKSNIRISKANSIDGREYSKVAPQEWKNFLAADGGSTTARARTWGSWNRLGCSVLATNPPFAGDMDESDVLDAYESQQLASSRSVISREHLFLERAVNLLRPDGRLAIVLPQGLLANPSASYLRQWLLKKCRILGVIGLHAHTFLPYTSVKTSLLFAARRSSDKEFDEKERIFFATSQSSGKDARGRTTGSNDYDSIGQAFKGFLSAQGLSWARYHEGSKPRAADSVALGEVVAADRLDAEHFDVDARTLVKALRMDGHQRSIGSLVDNSVQRFKRNLFNNICYLDISSVDSDTGAISPTLMKASEAPGRATYVVQPGDVLVSTVRPERNVVALVTETGDAPIIASNGFCLLRPKSVDPEVLFAYCKTDTFCKLLSRHATASMYPTVTDKDVLGTPFLEPAAQTKERVKKLIRSGFEMIRQGQNALAEAKQHMANPAATKTEALQLQEERGAYSKRKKRSQR